MRIGISTSVIQRGKTGIAQYVFALVRALLPYAGKHQLTLFVLEEDLPLFAFAAGKMEILPVAEKHRPPVKDILWHQFELPRMARQLELDVLHVPSYRRLLWQKPCALVATIHDLAPFHVARKYDLKRMIYGRVVARWLARRQDRVIAISQNTARDVQKFFGLPERKISVIHNGLDHGRFHEESRAIARTNASAKYALHRPFFLYVARLEHPAKNHVRLIAAFDQFKKATGSDWQLVFGGSDWSGAETIHAAIRNAHFGDDIKTLGFVDDKDLPGLYRAADAFVYPSLYEGFGMPPIEAMACGCPVISSACGSLGEVVGTAAAIVDPKDVNSIAEKLAVLASDEGERGRLRAAGLARAKCFNWMSTAAQTLQVYEEVCEAASRRTVASPRRKVRKRIPAYKTPMPGPQRSR